MHLRLLITIAIATALTATLASARAQTGPDSEESLPPSWNQGIVARPGAVQSANNANNSAAALGKPGKANPVPGSIVVNVNARVVFYGAVQGSSLDQTAGVGTANAGAAKLNPYTTLGFMRLYLGMDGMMTNGMRYGAAVEVRQNYGPATGSAANNQSSASTTGSTLYVRRAFAYLAGDQWGIVRLGQADSPLGIFDNGITTFQNFDDGAWNGDVQGAIPGNAQVTFPFLSLAGADYGSSKIVYLTPQFGGLDFGFSWAPNNAALQDGNCAFANSGCYNLSSSAVGSDATRLTNMYVVAARYQQVFGAVGVYGMAAYYGSGSVSYTGPTPASGFDNRFNGLSVGDAGLAISYAGITVGGHITAGSTNGQGALQPAGGVHAIAWLAGIQYTNGPLVIGNSFYNYQSQGSPALVGLTQRNENAYAAGLTWTIAPGLAIWASYVYGTRHQGGFNFQTGAQGVAFNNVQSQAFGVGPVVRW
ncbi:MAG: hypothetical protein JSR21_03930 [Proteobacteria bacterium]|nr:hypothetical protein [Pseudomonadota bacterium]